MMFQITVKQGDVGRYYTLTGAKVTMEISVTRGWVATCVHNAAAALHRNLGGKVFHHPNGLEKALAGYKSSTSKAMIQAVIDAENALATPTS